MSKRDEVARVIDPHCWFDLDTYTAGYQAVVRLSQGRALRQADAILALLSDPDDRMALAAARSLRDTVSNPNQYERAKAAIRAAMKAAGE